MICYLTQVRGTLRYIGGGVKNDQNWRYVPSGRPLNLGKYTISNAKPYQIYSMKLTTLGRYYPSSPLPCWAATKSLRMIKGVFF